MCLESGNGCVPKENKTMSLLKRKTNNDQINDMSVGEKAKAINSFVDGDCDICPFSKWYGDQQLCKIEALGWSCEQRYLRWLESEVSE